MKVEIHRCDLCGSDINDKNSFYISKDLLIHNDKGIYPSIEICHLCYGRLFNEMKSCISKINPEIYKIY